MALWLTRVLLALLVCHACQEFPSTSTARPSEGSNDHGDTNIGHLESTSVLLQAPRSYKGEFMRPPNDSGSQGYPQAPSEQARTPKLRDDGQKDERQIEENANVGFAGQRDGESLVREGSSSDELVSLMRRDIEGWTQTLETLFQGHDGIESRVFERDPQKKTEDAKSAAAASSFGHAMQPHRRPIYQPVGKILGVTWWQRHQPNSDQDKLYNAKSPFRPLGQNKSQITLPERNSWNFSDQDAASGRRAFEAPEDGFKRASLAIPRDPVEQDSSDTFGIASQDRSSQDSLLDAGDQVSDGTTFEKTQQKSSSKVPGQDSSNRNRFGLLRNAGEQNEWLNTHTSQQDSKSKQENDQEKDHRAHGDSQDEVLLVKRLQANDLDRDLAEKAKEGRHNITSGTQGRQLGIMESVNGGQSAGTDGHFRSDVRSSAAANSSWEWTQNKSEAAGALNADNPSLVRAAKTSETGGSLLWSSRPASSDVESWRSSPAFSAPGSQSHLRYSGNVMAASAGQSQAGFSVVLHVVNDSAAALTSSQGTTYLQYDPLTGQLTPAVSTTTTIVNGTNSDVVGYLQIDASRPILHPPPSHATDNDPIFGFVRLDHTSLQDGGSDLSTVIQNGAYLQFNPLGAATQQTNTTSQQATLYLQLEPAAQALLNSKSVGHQRVYLQFDPQLSSVVHTNNAGGYIVGVPIQPPKNLFLRMFKEGEIYIDGDAVVQNYYTDGGFERTLAHFRALPLDGVTPLGVGDVLSGHLKGYTVSACGTCGPRGEPMIEFISKFTANPIIKRRFLYVPQVSTWGYVGGGRVHQEDFSGPMPHGDVGGIAHHWRHGTFDDAGTSYISEKERRTVTGIVSKPPYDAMSVNLGRSPSVATNRVRGDVKMGHPVSTNGPKHLSQQNYQLVKKAAGGGK